MGESIKRQLMLTGILLLGAFATPNTALGGYTIN